MSDLIEWDDIVAKHPELAGKNVGADVMEKAFIKPSQAEIEGALAGFFTVPFSSNNITAKDLVSDTVFHKKMLTKKPKVAKSMREDIDRRLMNLKNGSMSMLTDSGDALGANTGTWSNTQGYHPVHGMGSSEVTFVSSDRLDDEENGRW